MIRKMQEVSVDFADGLTGTFSPDEALSLYTQLHSQRAKFTPDFFVSKTYVCDELKARYPQLKPMELTKYVGKLWGRLVHPKSPFDKFSSRGKKLARVTRQGPEKIRLSARNLLERHDTFDTSYQRGVGDVTKGQFDIIVEAIERDFRLSQG